MPIGLLKGKLINLMWRSLNQHWWIILHIDKPNEPMGVFFTREQAFNYFDEHIKDYYGKLQIVKGELFGKDICENE